MTVYVMLTGAQVEEGRSPWRVAQGREGVRDILMTEATDPQVCNHGDWHVWQVDDAEGGSAYLPERMADWIVSVVTVDRGEFEIHWFDTQIGDLPAVRRGRSAYEHGLGRQRKEAHG